MKYHPAKKEVEFRRFQDGIESKIRSDSKLMRYMNMRGRFVLQDFGNAFFNDIAYAFDGQKSVDMGVVTTRLDFEDLEQMLEFYNAGHPDCIINATLMAELPDMAQTFTAVRNYGERSITILSNYRQRLLATSSDHESVRQRAEEFARQIGEEIKSIEEKIESLSDNNVSLCFTGVYSAGKSALINALLGYRILPEAVSSETAKMVEIRSPGVGEPVEIEFDIDGVRARLKWDENSNCFEFSMAPTESPIRAGIQRLLNDLKDRGVRLHDQVRGILSDLNQREGISSDLAVRFPIPLDTERVQFTIYDTPGTDSNSESHKRVLNEALEEQTHSILVFVAHPTKLEGEGNNALLSYLKNAEEKSSKTSIDLGRSLFVMNFADTVMATDRETLREKEITNKEDGNFSIQLSDKKLFFISARYSYAAKAMRNGIATSEEEGLFKMGQMQFDTDYSPYRMCYQQNRCAGSECATRNLMEACDQALAEARNAADESRVLEVCSGLYAVEREIVLYGEKYAAAVRAFAIIDSVNKTLNKLDERARLLLDSNQREIEAIDADIRELKQTIDAAIYQAYRRYAIAPNQPLPDETRRKLMLDRGSLGTKVIGRVKRDIDKRLKGRFLFGLGSVKVKRSDRTAVSEIIRRAFEDFTDHFVDSRCKLLESKRDSYLRDVKRAIAENSSISDSAKNYFLDIPSPQVGEPGRLRSVGSIYDSHKRSESFLFFFTKEYLDKEGFIRDIEKEMRTAVSAMRDEYITDYIDALNSLLMQISGDFTSRLEEYSLDMHAMIDDREAMKGLGSLIQSAADELALSREGLNDIIWREAENA